MLQQIPKKTMLNIEHSYTTFYERVKYLIQLWVGIISLFGIFNMFSPNGNFLTFIIIVSLMFGILVSIKIYRNKLYIFKFYSDSQNVKISYLNGTKENTPIKEEEKTHPLKIWWNM